MQQAKWVKQLANVQFVRGQPVIPTRQMQQINRESSQPFFVAFLDQLFNRVEEFNLYSDTNKISIMENTREVSGEKVPLYLFLLGHMQMRVFIYQQYLAAEFVYIEWQKIHTMTKQLFSISFDKLGDASWRNKRALFSHDMVIKMLLTELVSLAYESTHQDRRFLLSGK
jgi:hypothetical protein